MDAQKETRLLVACNRRGQLNFRVQTASVEATTYFRNLQRPDVAGSKSSNHGDVNAQRDADAFVETTVDVRQFVRFLQCYQAHPKDVICCTGGIATCEGENHWANAYL